MANATLLPGRFAERAPVPAFDRRFVSRPRLLAPLTDPSGPPLALITAPAGYGRTTLLADWARHETREFAWIAVVPEHDDDPSLLAAAVADAIDVSGPFVLVLDDVQLLRSKGAKNVVRTLVERVPAGSRLALSSRTEPSLPVGRLRAQHALVEIGPRDLAMTLAEAADLLEAEGARLPAHEVDSLVRRTEGWPVALYLAALAGRELSRGVEQFGGDDIAVRQYLAESVLHDLPYRVARFLTSTSVADRLSGALCDAMLGCEGSGKLLEELAVHRRLLIPLDRAGEWYRCPAPLREMLGSELRRADPTGERDIRRRAVDWYAAHDDSARAIDQAIAAQELDTAGELLWAHAPGEVAAGRCAAVRGWLGALTDEQIAADPRVAMVAACVAFSRGDLAVVLRWEAAAREGLRDAQRLPGGEELAATTAAMRAALAGDSLHTTALEAGAARRRMPEASPWRSMCCFLEGSELFLAGELPRAEALLEEGARRGAVIAPSHHALCLAQLALMAIDRGDWEGAAALAARARARIDHDELPSYPTSALVFAVSAAVGARRGRVDKAQRDVRHALRLLDRVADFAPWYLAEVRATLARAALRLSDIVTARELIDAARRDGRRVPDSRLLAAWISDLEAAADAASAPAALTTAELRILRFLPTHLSFREIAARLYVSANTVKTQAHAVYRKLDASSRSQAVARASELGLLDS